MYESNYGSRVFFSSFFFLSSLDVHSDIDLLYFLTLLFRLLLSITFQGNSLQSYIGYIKMPQSWSSSLAMSSINYFIMLNWDRVDFNFSLS